MMVAKINGSRMSEQRFGKLSPIVISKSSNYISSNLLDFVRICSKLKIFGEMKSNLAWERRSAYKMNSRVLVGMAMEHAQPDPQIFKTVSTRLKFIIFLSVLTY